MEHEYEAENTKWKKYLGLRTLMYDHEAYIQSGASSRRWQTRRKAWAQSHGSELGSDSRVAEGRIIQEAAYVSGFAGIRTVRHLNFSPDKERRYDESCHEFC